jgi:hypothetical protein
MATQVWTDETGRLWTDAGTAANMSGRTATRRDEARSIRYMPRADREAYAARFRQLAEQVKAQATPAERRRWDAIDARYAERAVVGQNEDL